MPTLSARRAVFFNLLQIQLPVGAVTSITHRIAGVLLVLALPVLAYALDRSVASPEAYAGLVACLRNGWARPAELLLLWALTHHVLAGIRHLLMDIDVGSELAAARRSAWLINLGSLVVPVLALGSWM